MSTTAPGSRSLLASALLLLGVLPVGCGPSDPLEEIRELQAAGRFQESLEPLRELLETRGEDPEVHYLYGFALATTGNPSLALFSLSKAMESPEWIAPAGLQIASSALRTGDFDTATETLTRVLEVQPENTQALVLRAHARAHSRRDYEGTLADAERALEIDPDEVEALIPKAVALLGLQRVEEAGAVIEELEERFDEDPLRFQGNPALCAARATFAKEKRETETADRLYRECLERFPDDPLLVENAIGFYDGTGQPERVLEILRQALEKAPLARGYRVSLVLRLSAQGKHEEAEALLRDATNAEQPELAAGAWADLGGYYLERRDFAAGVAAYARAVELVPAPSPELLLTYAEALIVAGEYDDALELSGRMTTAAHRDLVQGRVHLARGDAAQALERFTSGLREWPQNAVGRYYAALAAEEIGDFDRAIEEYRYSIRSDPAATDARLRLARLHAAEGAHAIALAVLTTDVARRPEDVEMALFELELLARLGRIAARPPPHLARLVAAPEVHPRAVAAMARGTRARRGAAAAAELVRSAGGLDLAQPGNAEALRELVVDLTEAGKPDEALALADAGLAAAPEAAAFHAIRALALAGRRAPADQVRAAYERALELDAANAQALAGLAGLRLEAGDGREALALYERAAAAAPEDPSSARAAADLLIAQGRREEAEKQLEDLLDRHPYEGRAALRLAELQIERGADAARTRALARRAARFGAGPEAAALLERLGEPPAAREG